MHRPGARAALLLKNEAPEVGLLLAQIFGHPDDEDMRIKTIRRGTRRRKEMRVLMVTSDWPPPGVPRTTAFIRRQAEFVQKAGVDLEVFAFKGGKNPYNYVKAWARLRRRLRKGGFDLLHAQFGQSGLLAFPKRLPLVVTFRGSDVLGIVRDKNGRYSRAGKLLQRASRFVAKRADAVILVSRHLGRRLKTKAPTHVIPSGIDFSLFRPIPQAEARKQLKFGPQERLVLFVGRPSQARKRFKLAKRAVDLVNDRFPGGVRLVVAWQVLHQDIPLYMNACDALVFTSMQEGSPNVVKEALACDLPVVSVKVGDVPDRLRGIEGCELCADDKPETIAAALERVLKRGARVAGHQAVRYLDENMLTAKVLNVYRSVLPSSGRRAIRARPPMPRPRRSGPRRAASR
jgi:glycosyltransferase involved in cell wall biosynthesis